MIGLVRKQVLGVAKKYEPFAVRHDTRTYFFYHKSGDGSFDRSRSM